LNKKDWIFDVFLFRGIGKGYLLMWFCQPMSRPAIALMRLEWQAVAAWSAWRSWAETL
jgi:hypothetical protein